MSLPAAYAPPYKAAPQEFSPCMLPVLPKPPGPCPNGPPISFCYSAGAPSSPRATTSA
ncbi:protein of unknown function [Cupriavidus neocaledonicus]|uniref:Uncharacterized protein n=1 Tax=Cupriavidus neocaledonicus TaxID=1040979 RepID=A0A375H8N4_9BURK|nr:protein of unknown function [Cupriavidus neocaledonicus]